MWPEADGGFPGGSDGGRSCFQISDVTQLRAVEAERKTERKKERKEKGPRCDFMS